MRTRSWKLAPVRARGGERGEEEGRGEEKTKGGGGKGRKRKDVGEGKA